MKNIPHLPPLLLLLLSICLLAPLQAAWADSATVTIGTAASSNGSWSGASPDVWTPGASGVSTVAASEITDRLANSGVIIGLGSSITVATPISWSANKLTLTATNDININAVMTASGSSSLTLTPGGAVNFVFNPGHNGTGSRSFAGRLDFPDRSGAGFLTINGQDYTVIQTRAQLEAISGNLAGHYALGGDVNIGGGTFWTPLGNQATPFTGAFSGLGHVLWNPNLGNSGSDYQGLFGYNTGTLENVQISMDGMYSNVFGVNFAGSLAGANDTGGIVRNVVAMMDGASIGGTGQFVGGLVGANSGTILNSHVVPFNVYGADIHGTNSVGGLVGDNEGAIYNSSASFDVVGQFSMALGQGFGGLVGVNNGAIANSYASGSVNPSYAEGVGGLVGSVDYCQSSCPSITDSYATGTVGNAFATNALVGGLVGRLSTGSIANSYATVVVVVGQSAAGGLVGWRNTLGATVTNSFWDTLASGQSTSDGGTGKTSAELTQAATFAGWDISTTGGSSAVWRIYDGQTTPLLRSFLTPMSVTANNVAKNYDATAYNGGNGVQYAPASYDAARVAGTLTYSGSYQGATAIGSYTITPDGLFSDQLGYDISFIGGVLNINGYWLTLAISGNGTVNSSNGSGLGYACNTATCSAVPFGSGDTVTLTATGSNSSFSSWSGDYVSISNPGSITMTDDKAVTATFSATTASVKIDGDSTPYYSINSVLAAPTQDAIIRATATGFTENVTMQNSHTLTLKGGYGDATFTEQTGYSTINGTLTVKSGKLIVDRVKIGP